MYISEIFESEKGQRRSTKRVTICEVIRQIYDKLILRLVDEDEEFLEEVIPLLEEAYIMGMKMARRMIEQKIYDIDEIEPREMTKEFRETRKKLRFERIDVMKRLRQAETIKAEQDD